MLRLAATAALALTAATPALAFQYHAAPAAKPAQTKIVLKDTIWTCGDNGCAAAGKSSSRPAIVCASLAKKTGKLQSFSVAGQALAPVDLEKCNAAAS